LVPGGASGVYVPPGFLLTQPGNQLVARRFDLGDGTVRGTAAPVLAGMRLGDLVNAVVNERGDAAYFAFGTALPSLLVRVDRDGRGVRLPVDPSNYRHPRLSHDGTRAAFSLGALGDLWILDLRDNTWQRLTTNMSITEPQWSPDDSRLIHTIEDTVSGYNLPAWRSSSGGDATLIQRMVGDAWVSDWSPNGRYLAIYGGPVGMNVGVLDMEQPDSLHHVTQVVEATARNPRFSPDGRWLAYQSNETGTMQVYVIEWATLGQKKAISTEGGTEPAWHPRGGELFYRNGPSMMVVDIVTSPTMTVGAPRQLFREPYLEDLYGDRSFDVMPDGQQFLMFEANPAAAPELRVIRNWAVELDSLTRGK
jgi:Tol biopolymer transport system component